MEDKKAETKPRRPRKIGLNRKKEQERDPSPLLGQLTFDELITAEIEQDKEIWLDKVNVHLENILKKAERDNKLQRHMARHYFTRNQIAKVRVKNLRKKLKETLIKLKEKYSLEFIVEAPLFVYIIIQGCNEENFRRF